MNSSESAEEIVKLSLEGVEMALRITGSGAKNVAAILYTLAKDNKQLKTGKTGLNNMLKSNSQLQIFSLKESQLKKFHEESKKYGVLYTALVDKKHKDTDGLVDIMVRAEDAAKVNRIVERFNLAAVDIASIRGEIEKDKLEEQKTENAEKVVDDILSKPKEGSEVTITPPLSKTEKDPLSEPSLMNNEKSGVVSKQKKPSVRKMLEEIKQDLAQKNIDRNSLDKIGKKKDKKRNKKDKGRDRIK